MEFGFGVVPTCFIIVVDFVDVVVVNLETYLKSLVKIESLISNRASYKHYPYELGEVV